MADNRTAMSDHCKRILNWILNKQSLPYRHRHTERSLHGGTLLKQDLFVSLFISDNQERGTRSPIPRIGDLVIRSDGLTQEFAQILSRLLPNLQHLTIYFVHNISWALLLPLLTLGSTRTGSNLKTVRLYGICLTREIDLDLVAGRINGMSTLSSFTLTVRGLGLRLMPLLGITLPRLNALHCSVDSPFQWQLNCSHLMIHHNVFNTFSRTRFFPFLANNLSRLCLFGCNHVQWNSLFQLQNLTSLTMYIHFNEEVSSYLNFPFPSLIMFPCPTQTLFLDSLLFARLAHFPSLLDFKVFSISSLEPLTLPLTLPAAEEQPSPSIHLLTFQVTFLEDPLLFSVPFFLTILSVWFPNLRRLILILDDYLILSVSSIGDRYGFQVYAIREISFKHNSLDL